MPSSTARTGAVGAFYTAAQLAERGWDASLTIGNTPRTDVIAQHHDQLLIAVQCKASTSNGKFSLNPNCELPSLPGRNEWFILVALRGPDERSDFFIVPRNVVAAYVYVQYRVWQTVPGRSGQPHGHSTWRDVHHRAVECYRERWELLEQSPDSVPYWLPNWVFDWEPETGLPASHPGLTRPTDGAMSEENAVWTPSWMPTGPAGRSASAR